MSTRLAATGLAVLLGAAAPDGWQPYAAGHYAEAVSAWSAAAARGDPEALFGLGLAYDLGHGIGQDERLACDYYRRAADAGIVAAAFNEAALQEDDKCGPHSTEATAIWYARAAAAGDPRAMYDLAQLYEGGGGVPQNPAMAATWYHMAGAAGLAAAAARARLLPQPQDANGTITPASPAWPVEDTLPDRGIAVPFIWSAPTQPDNVRFYLEIYALGDTPREIAARYVEASASMVVLPPGAAAYAWRVSVVAPGAHRYVGCGWRRFSVK